ncbi:MAG: thiol:disulfide interchange protein DsbA/DsbL [Pseudomonadota bacterium]
MRMISNLMFAAVLCFSVTAVASPAAPANGVEYLTLPQVQNTDAGKAVEVTEFFSYNCPHCNLFDPALAAWVKKQGDNIVFKRVHLALHHTDAAVQRLFYTLEAMGNLEQMHAKVFAAIHDQRVRLSNDEQVFDWAEKAGIDRAKFIATYRSFGMQSKVSRANRLTSDYRVNQWPMIAVGGRYMTSPTQASSTMPQLSEAEQHPVGLQVMDFLLAKAKSDKK